MNKLQAGVKQALTVFPKSPVLVQPREAALNDPALGNDRKGVQLASLGDLHRHVPA